MGVLCMRLSREAIQRMVGGAGGSVGGGGVDMSSMLAGYATQEWVNGNFLSIGFFSRLFQAHGQDGNVVTDIAPNDMESVVTDIESMFGFWTERWLSAMGRNDSEGGGGATSLGELSDVALSSPTDGQVLMYDSETGKWINGTAGGGGGGGEGTVTRVGVSVPTGFAVSGSPITDSGTIAISFASGYSLPSNTKQQEWDEAYSWGDHSLAGYLTQQSLTGYATQDWVQAQGYVDTVGGIFWGKSWSNGDRLSGDLLAGSNGGSLLQFHSIELNSAGSQLSNGGFIDFHFGGSSSDYTSRVIEDASGVVHVLSSGSVSGLRIGGSGADYVEIGGCRLTWDSTNGALKVERSDGTAAGIYATGFVSALGLSSGSSAVDAMTFGNVLITDRLRLSANSYTHSVYGNDDGELVVSASEGLRLNCDVDGNGYNISTNGGELNAGDGYVRGSRLYIGASRYFYVESGVLKFFDGTQAKEIAFV